MKKFIYLLVIFVVLWLAKLSYDSYMVSNQLSDIQQALHKSEQNNANLNDQLVALQRSSQSLNVQSGSVQSNVAQTNQATLSQHNLTQSTQVHVKDMGTLSPSLLLKQQLDLIQFALQQQQYVYALEQLNQFDFNVEKYELAETVKKSLHLAIEQDRKAIQNHVLQTNMQLARLDDALEQVEEILNVEKNNKDLKIGSDLNDYFWQKWFKLDVIDQPSTSLMNRKLVLKEIQLRMISAQQVLAKGQFLEYQKILGLIVQELNALPDQASQKLRKSIQTLQHTQMQPAPKLSSAAILE